MKTSTQRSAHGRIARLELENERLTAGIDELIRRLEQKEAEVEQLKSKNDELRLACEEEKKKNPSSVSHVHDALDMLTAAQVRIKELELALEYSEQAFDIVVAACGKDKVFEQLSLLKAAQQSGDVDL